MTNKSFLTHFLFLVFWSTIASAQPMGTTSTYSSPTQPTSTATPPSGTQTELETCLRKCEAAFLGCRINLVNQCAQSFMLCQNAPIPLPAGACSIALISCLDLNDVIGCYGQAVGCKIDCANEELERVTK